MEYREEQKYIVTRRQAFELALKLSKVCERDIHADAGYSYRVRSLYFDDVYDTFFFENESGTDDRQKIRLRIYNANPDRISLEIKEKSRGYTKKRMAEISRGAAEKFIKTGLVDTDRGEDRAFFERMYAYTRVRVIRPKVIAEYDRRVFAGRTGNVRITFDSGIRASYNFASFFEKKPPFVPVFPPGLQIMEVKYDGILPGYIKEILGTGDLNRTSFSKYYASRLSPEGEFLYEIQ